MNSIIVVQNCTASFPGLPNESFETGELIQPWEKFYWPMLWAGLATDSGLEPEPIDPDAVHEYQVVALKRGVAVADGDVVQYDDDEGTWVSVPSATFGVEYGHPIGPLVAALGRRTTSPARFLFLGGGEVLGTGASVATKRWVDVFNSRIQSAYPSGTGTETAVRTLAETPPATPGVQCIVGAANGATSANYVLPAAILARIDAINPDAVFHMVGAAESTPGAGYISPRQYRANIIASIDAIDARGGASAPTCHVLIHGYRRSGVGKKAWREYGDVLLGIANTRENVMFVDMSLTFDTMNHDTPDPYNVIAPDLISPTDTGHAVIADLVSKGLRIGLAARPGGASSAALNVEFTPAGNIAAVNVQQALVELDNKKVSKLETRTATAIARRIDLNYAINAAQPNLSEVAVNGIVRSWHNEAGFFRGRQHYADYADALVRGIVEDGDFTGLSNGGGNFLEIVNRILPEGRARQMWGVRWSNGKVVRNGVEVPDLWYRGSASSAFDPEMPAGTLLFTADGEQSGPRATIALWDGGELLPTVTGLVSLATEVGIPESPSIKIETSAAAAYARWDFATVGSLSARFYLRTPSAWPTAAVTIAGLRPSASALTAGIALTGTASPGRLRLIATSGTIVAESAPVLAVSTNYRVEVRYNSAQKVAFLSVYAMGQNAPLWASGPIANNAFAGGINRVDIGRINNTPTAGDFWIDNIEIVERSGAPVGRHASDALASSPTPTPPYAGALSYWDGANLLSAMNHTMPASEVLYAGSQFASAGGLLPSTVEDAIDTLDRARAGAIAQASVSLDYVLEPGTHLIGHAHAAVGGAPVAYGGYLEVFSYLGSQFGQVYRTLAGGGDRVFYRARSTAGGWGAWVEFSKVDQRAKVVLSVTDSLDNYTTPGTYVLQSSGAGISASYPTPGFQGIIEVQANAALTQVIQRATATVDAAGGGGFSWTRAKHGSVWSNWSPTSGHSAIPSPVDLNTLTTTGEYMFTYNAANANVPVPDGFFVKVFSAASGTPYKYQWVTQLGATGATYTRKYNPSTQIWTDWLLEGAGAVSAHALATDPHPGYARKATQNTFTQMQRIESPTQNALIVSRSSNTANLKEWRTYIDTSGTLVIAAYDDAGVLQGLNTAFRRDGSVVRYSESGTLAVTDIVDQGMPEGRIAAGIGSTYTDALATNGAVTWVKTIGSGSTGWRVSDGDTGWRWISRWDTSGAIVSGVPLGAGWGPSSTGAGGIRIRRIGQTVEIHVIRVAATAVSPTAVIAAIPTGFIPENTILFAPVCFAANHATKATSLQVNPAGSIGRAGNITVAVGDYWTEQSIVYSTTQPWPSTLTMPTT